MTKKLSRISWSGLSTGKLLGIVGVVIGFTASFSLSFLVAGTGSALYVFCDMEQERQRGVQ